MADNARFHNKYHRRNHHTLPSAGFPDSGSDPIASQAEPFQGSFYVQGSLSASNDLTIGGNTIIYGNLSALGDVSVIDTFVTVTSALSVVNKGTGPALTVIQEGIQDIAVFLDDTKNALKIMDSAKIRFFEEGSSGAIGINTTNLSNALTIKGSVSASGSLNINGSTTLGDTNTDTNILRGIVKIADSSASNGILLGSDDASYDANLYRSTANTLKTDDNFIIDLDLNVNGNTTLGNANTDTTTINGTTVSIPNNLNIDSNTLYINSSNDKVGIGTATPNAKLTVSGDISATNSVVGVSLSGRFIDISHTPANDGSNPYLRIGEATSDAVNFSGFQIEYNETTNDLNLSATGFNTSREALKITSAGNTRVNLLSAISPNYNNLTAATRGISGAGFDDLSHLINGRVGVNNQAPVSSYALHVKGGNIRVDGVDFSAVPGFDGTIYDSDGQSLFDLRSAQENANYSLSIASSGLNNFMKFFGGRSLDQKPFVAVRKGQPIRFAQLNNFYGQGFSEMARIGGNGNVSIGLSANGAERLTVLGNISASGTTTTQAISVLKTDTGSDASLTILAGNTVGDAASIFFGHDTGRNRGQIRYYNGGIESMAFSTSTVEAMRIRSSGNVGIATTLPAEKLTVSGNISSNGSLFTTAITSRGLDLIHSPANDGTNPILRIGEIDYTTGNAGFSGAFMSYDETTNVFGISSIFAPAMGVPAIAIDRNSYVGVGINVPQARMHNTGTSYNQVPQFAGTANVVYEHVFGLSTGSRRFLIANDNKNLTLPTAGTNNLFEVIRNTDGSAETRVYTGTGTIDSSIIGGANSYFAKTSANKVGIGTDTPTEKLTVSGSISALSAVYTIGIKPGLIPALFKIDGVNMLASVGTRTLAYTVPAGLKFTASGLKMIMTSTDQSAAFTTAPSIALNNNAGNKLINDLTLSVSYVHAAGNILNQSGGYGGGGASRTFSTDTVNVEIVGPALVGGTQTTMVASIIIMGELF